MQAPTATWLSMKTSTCRPPNLTPFCLSRNSTCLSFRATIGAKVSKFRSQAHVSRNELLSADSPGRKSSRDK